MFVYDDDDEAVDGHRASGVPSPFVSCKSLQRSCTCQSGGALRYSGEPARHGTEHARTSSYGTSCGPNQPTKLICTLGLVDLDDEQAIYGAQLNAALYAAMENSRSPYRAQFDLIEQSAVGGGAHANPIQSFRFGSAKSTSPFISQGR